MNKIHNGNTKVDAFRAKTIQERLDGRKKSNSFEIATLFTLP